MSTLSTIVVENDRGRPASLHDAPDLDRGVVVSAVCVLAENRSADRQRWTTVSGAHRRDETYKEEVFLGSDCFRLGHFGPGRRHMSTWCRNRLDAQQRSATMPILIPRLLSR